MTYTQENPENLYGHRRVEIRKVNWVVVAAGGVVGPAAVELTELGNLVTGNFHFGFTLQPIAHSVS